MNAANFEIVRDIPGQPLVIRDIGPWTQHMTVTNDAENVVKRLHVDGLLSDGRKLYYYDTNGDYDEIVHDNGAFRGFRAGTRSV